MAHDVFVSYPSVDKPVADGAVAALEAAGLRCWYAPRDLVPGADWAGSIVQAIGTARLAVLVFSDATNESEHILREVRHAADARIPIIPFRTAPGAPSPALEYYIGGTHWLDALTPPLESHFADLVETARRVTAGGAARAASTPAVATGGVGRAGRPPSQVPRWAVPGAGVLVVVAAVVVAMLVSGDGSPGPTAPDDRMARLAGSTLVPAGGFEWLVRPETGNRYALTRAGMSWEVLEREAREQGAHLVWIEDEAEEAWLYDRFPTPSFWIGLTDAGVEGEWRWTSGEEARFERWCPGEPTDAAGGAGTEDAAHVVAESRCWSDEVTWATEFLEPDGSTSPGYPGVVELEAGSGSG